MRGVVGSLTDQGYLVEKMRKDWGYEFAKGVDEYEVV